jgi:hypothetical protein
MQHVNLRTAAVLVGLLVAYGVLRWRGIAVPEALSVALSASIMAVMPSLSPTLAKWVSK